MVVLHRQLQLQLQFQMKVVEAIHTAEFVKTMTIQDTPKLWSLPDTLERIRAIVYIIEEETVKSQGSCVGK